MKSALSSGAPTSRYIKLRRIIYSASGLSKPSACLVQGAAVGLKPVARHRGRQCRLRAVRVGRHQGRKAEVRCGRKRTQAPPETGRSRRTCIDNHSWYTVVLDHRSSTRLNFPANALELFNERRDALEHISFFGQVLWIERAHFW